MPQIDIETTKKLVVRAQNGDEAAKAELLGEYYNPLYFFILKTVKNEDLAGDVLQETMIKILTSLNQLTEPAAFPAWSRRIAFNESMRQYRGVREVVPETDDGEATMILDRVPEADRTVLPGEVMEDVEFKEEIRRIIDSLPPEQSSAMMLYYYENYSVQDIAGIQGVSEGTVKSRLNYGRKAVQKKLEEYQKKTGYKVFGISIASLIAFMLGAEFAKVASTFGAAVATGAAGAAASGIGVTGGAGNVISAGSAGNAGSAGGTFNSGSAANTGSAGGTFNSGNAGGAGNARNLSGSSANPYQQTSFQPNQYQQPGVQPNQYQQPNIQPNQYQQPGIQPNVQPNQYQQPNIQPNQYQQPSIQPNVQPNQYQQYNVQPQPGYQNTPVNNYNPAFNPYCPTVNPNNVVTPGNYPGTDPIRGVPGGASYAGGMSTGGMAAGGAAAGGAAAGAAVAGIGAGVVAGAVAKKSLSWVAKLLIALLVTAAVGGSVFGGYKIYMKIKESKTRYYEIYSVKGDLWGAFWGGMGIDTSEIDTSREYKVDNLGVIVEWIFQSIGLLPKEENYVVLEPGGTGFMQLTGVTYELKWKGSHIWFADSEYSNYSMDIRGNKIIFKVDDATVKFKETGGTPPERY